MERFSDIAKQVNQIEDDIGITFDDKLNKLTQELGEFNDAVQKYRGRYSKTKYDTLDEVKSELGDLIANIITICEKLGINPDDLQQFAEVTLHKLEERKDLYRNTLKKDI